MAKATHGISVNRNTKDMTVTFSLVDKATEKAIDTLVIKWADVHDDCKDFTSLYGLSKILQDRESSADMMEKLTVYLTCFEDTLKAGILNRERKSGGPTVRIEIEALAALKDLTVKQAQTLLRKYDKAQQEVILKSELVATKVAEMQETASPEPEDNAFDDLLTVTTKD